MSAVVTPSVEASTMHNDNAAGVAEGALSKVDQLNRTIGGLEVKLEMAETENEKSKAEIVELKRKLSKFEEKTSRKRAKVTPTPNPAATTLPVAIPWPATFQLPNQESELMETYFCAHPMNLVQASQKGKTRGVWYNPAEVRPCSKDQGLLEPITSFSLLTRGPDKGIALKADCVKHEVSKKQTQAAS